MTYLKMQKRKNGEVEVLGYYDTEKDRMSDEYLNRLLPEEEWANRTAEQHQASFSGPYVFAFPVDESEVPDHAFDGGNEE